MKRTKSIFCFKREDCKIEAKFRKKHRTAKLKKQGKQPTLWITKNVSNKLAVKMMTKFKERPCNTEFRLVVHINKNTTINYMF
jgi:hypothetical protein